MDSQLDLPALSIAHSKRSQQESIWQSADIDSKEILRQLQQGNPWPELITYDGPSCPCNSRHAESSGGGDGPGSCALISLFCARTILDVEKQLRAREYRSEGRSKEEEAWGLLDDILAERTVQRVVSIGQHLKGALKLGPSELLVVPLFEKVLFSSERIERFTSYQEILKLLGQLGKDSARRVACTIITQSPQTALCVKLSILDEDLFLVFDPHRRSERPNGPSFMLSTSRTATATFIASLLDAPFVHDVTTRATDPRHNREVFMAHLLEAKEEYHKITAYQNEQTLRDSFLCAHEEALSASVDYVNLYNQLLTGPDVGPSNSSTPPRILTESIASESNINLRVDPTSIHPRPSSPLLTLVASRPVHVSDSPWRTEAFSQSLMEQLKMISNDRDRSLPDFSMKFTFDCAVCLETFPVRASEQMSGCEHRFCRDCLKGHIHSFLGNGRFPIECPVCLLDRNIPDPGNVTTPMLSRLDLPPESTDKFVELKLLQHSVRLDCPKCTQPQTIARKEYLSSKHLSCESPQCLNKWCKFCSKNLSDSKGKHSCKGDSFEKLMKKKGWRHCPGCTMPVLKDSGCNHMACPAPGCHTHFCYKCGKLIITSSTGRGVGEEVTLHYTNGCRQFERRLPKCDIQ